jgi:hypothetical protein
LKELYRLGEIDADDGAGISMRIEIIKLKNCPADLIDQALNSNEKNLVEFARRKLGLEDN